MRTIRFASALSSETESAAGSEPVYGMSSSSSSDGTCDSRLRPLNPSAMLKTTSTGVEAST